MRLCRFSLDEDILLGFYAEDAIVPIDAACEAYGEATGVELALASGDDLLELVGPDGPYREATRTLSDWVDGLDADERDAIAIPIDEVALLVPIAMPGKILLLAGNYAKHVIERGGTAAERAETFPYVFLKPPSSTLTNPDDPIRIPASSPDHIDWECELAVVIGRECREVSEEEALEYVAGYTVLNDISDRKFTPNPGRKPRERDKFFDWQHGKWHDTFCPMGPCVLSADAVPDPQNLALRLDGQRRTEAERIRPSQMVFPVAAIVISFLSSKFMTLRARRRDLDWDRRPAWARPAGTYLKPGDVVAATVGRASARCVNPVVAEPDSIRNWGTLGSRSARPAHLPASPSSSRSRTISHPNVRVR